MPRKPKSQQKRAFGGEAVMGKTRKPSEGPCEMVVGYDSSGPHVRVLKCHRPGLERLEVPTFFAAPIMCDECYRDRRPVDDGEGGAFG